MGNAVVLAWSGGKDSALALDELSRQRVEIAALLTTVTEGHDRISMHGVRRALLERQAASLGLPLETVIISQEATNEEYEARMEALLPLARRHGLAIVEDAAQAIGARRRLDGQWRLAGELGTTGAFSFFPSKNLGAWGDGGMMVTQDAALAERLRKLRVHGGAKQYFHEEIGTNSRLDTLQAVVLGAKLPHLADWSARRRAHAAFYTQALAGVDGITPPVTDPANEHIFHQYTIRSRRRDDLVAWLKQKGIGCAVYYPKPLHLQPCFAPLGYREGQVTASEQRCGEVRSLPVCP